MFVQLTKEYLGHPPGKRLDVSQADAEALIKGGNAQAVAASLDKLRGRV